MSVDLNKIKNVLILAPDKHMGDLVLSLSAIKALSNLFKEKNFHLVIDSAYSEIIETLGDIGNIMTYPRSALKGRSLAEKAFILLDFFRELRKTSPDIAIDLHGIVASSTITFLSGAHVRMGRITAKRPYFYNYKVDIIHNRHKFFTFTDIAHKAGVQDRIEPLSISPSEKMSASLKKILTGENISSGKSYICIHPGAGVKHKQWTEEGFAAVSDRLSSNGYQAIFIGGRGESEKVKRIMSIMKQKAYNLAGKLSLGMLIALFKTGSLYIGNDSGPMHLAAATGIPIVALYGPASENRWGPLSENSITLRGCERCTKCTGRECLYDFRCIKDISADDVISSAEKLLRATDK